MTSDASGLKRWDVAVALFPFTESAQRKPRPVVILSDSGFNEAHGHVIAAMITTGARSQWPTDHTIAEMEPTGLSHASVVRWKVFTLPRDIISRRIGAFGAQDRGVCAAKMAGILLG
ncbi:MAG: type II toxin-antitoxin system PemK/MazF family toxin [Bosea sp. (in: a-proteobacteria)]